MYMFIGILVIAVLIYFGIRMDRVFNPVPEESKCESPIETRMYHALVELGLEPQCQKKVGYYRLDLAIVHYGVKLAIECDGKEYHSSPEQKRHDRKRTRYLQDRGWTVIRFSGARINRNALQCALEVDEKLEQLHERRSLNLGLF